MVCPDWRDPLNVGSVFRLADAAGLSGLVLGGKTPAPPNNKINKTARSTVRSIPYAIAIDTLAWLVAKQQAGALIIVLEITDQSQSLLSYRLPDHVLNGDREVYLIAGSESAGIAPELLAICDQAVHLPMFGQNTSMNVAVAMGAAVYLLLAQFDA
ncbi:TrmH family RNA methyltransferase [Neolewinella agarilytica]|uniref:TrmH family RNA methyltransferase n=1 Tax=Neolewinella agarilytica TaxID=478744 RepID=UPI0021CD340B|nr:TrmH family RNA methyltransferase [Neolewinella agarilytica]